MKTLSDAETKGVNGVKLIATAFVYVHGDRTIVVFYGITVEIPLMYRPSLQRSTVR